MTRAALLRVLDALYDKDPTFAIALVEAELDHDAGLPVRIPRCAICHHRAWPGFELGHSRVLHDLHDRGEGA